MADPREPRILNLDPPVHLKGTPQERSLAYLERLSKIRGRRNQ